MRVVFFCGHNLDGWISEGVTMQLARELDDVPTTFDLNSLVLSDVA